jgi:two-component system response regulator MprA
VLDLRVSVAGPITNGLAQRRRRYNGGVAKERLLLVDDDPRVLSSVGRRLTFEGFDVDLAADGPVALELAATRPPDLVILDVMMPGMDGLEVARRLRRLGPVPILMLTARDAVSDKVAGFQSGADDYVVKPFAFEELLARIGALLRRARPAQPERLVFADLEMDLATREVTRGGEPIELTARGFALLEHFMRHPRQVLTREQIFAAVWGSDFMGASNVIDVNISYLRERLEVGGRPRLVQTVRGVGYALREPNPSVGVRSTPED